VAADAVTWITAKEHDRTDHQIIDPADLSVNL